MDSVIEEHRTLMTKKANCKRKSKIHQKQANGDGHSTLSILA